LPDLKGDSGSAYHRFEPGIKMQMKVYFSIVSGCLSANFRHTVNSLIAYFTETHSAGGEKDDVYGFDAGISGGQFL
jgi:hypothetical protein